MGRSEMAAYEAEVDKLCAQWAVNVAKELKHCVTEIESYSAGLAKAISSVKVPQGLDDKELNDIPDRINKILKDDSDRVRDVIELKVTAKVDVKKKKVDISSWGYSGKLVELV